MNELIGKYLNGYRIAKVEKDPFIKGQIILWTDYTKLNFLGDKEVVKFYIRDYPSEASIYQEQDDKENYQLKSILKEVRKKLNFYETTECGMNGYEVLQDIRKILDKEVN